MSSQEAKGGGRVVGIGARPVRLGSLTGDEHSGSVAGAAVRAD
ncbi:hypothetical protein [Janibacter alittae]|uniref:Uncharacterized protein n=1 Tax=Janibacter alittae TaxID=3115209 RepID=A0ABZ2MGM6_9MICO